MTLKKHPDDSHMIRAAQIFSSLPGRWAIHRVIAGEGVVKGTASFSPSDDPNALQYQEEGTFTKVDGTTLRIHQQYKYHLVDGKVSVFLKEGGLLHTLNFADDTSATGEHLCVRDTYKATYNFKSSQEFHLTYKVTGPKKDYCMTTIFQRSI